MSSPVYTLLTTDVICYNGASSSCSTAVVQYPITEKDTYHTVAGMSSSSRTQITYDGYGNVTSVAKYDFGASSFTYKTTTAYGSWSGSQCGAVGSNINNRPCDVVTMDGTNTLSETRYSYDSHGNLLTKSRWTGSTWLSSSATFNANGTVATSTDVNNAQTTYSYAPTGSGGCNGLLLTQAQVTVASGDTLTTSQTWDSACNGAVRMSGTDANGNSTTYNYNDPYFRVTSVADPTGYTKYINYISPTETDAYDSFTGNHLTTYDDGLGRVILTQKQESASSSNYDSVSSSYGWNGTVFQTGASMPCVQTQGIGCSSYFTFSSTDPLGRILSIQDAGTGTLTGTYAQNDAKVTAGPPPAGENTKNVQREYDGLGRPKSTCQILASGGTSCGQNVAASGYLTSYTYPTLAGGSKKIATRGVQTRTSVFDALGRLASQTNPESQTASSVYDTESSCGPYGSYTSNGDLLKATDARGVNTCYYYDAIHRVTDVGNSSQSTTNPCKRFRYDNTQGVLGAIPAGVTVSNTMGHIAEAETDTCATPITQSSIITDEWFSYDKDGRLTDVYELTPHSGSYYHTSVGYFPNAAVNSLSGLPGLSTYNYNVDGEGRSYSAVQGTTTFINGVTYNAGSQPTIVQVGTSGDQDTYTYDPATGRMTNYTFTVNSVSESGALNWNVNGSLRQLAITDGFDSGGTQTCNFGTSGVMGYDDLGRLLSDNCGSIWSQTFSYDQYDNVTKSGSISWIPGYNPSNNQYSSIGATYDASGNLTYDSFNTYTWDAYGKMASVRASTSAAVCGTSGTCVTYDALGRAVEKNVSGNYTEILYSPLGKTAIMNGQTLTNAYVPMPGGQSSLYDATGGHHVEHHNWRGDVVLRTSLHNRSKEYDRAFAAFGEMYDNFGNSGMLNFTGDTQDIFGGLFDTPNRELAPTQGRWISPDPAGAGWNPYAYVSNDPLDMTDASGLCPYCDFSHADKVDAICWGCQRGSLGDPFMVFDASSGAFVVDFGAMWMEYENRQFLAQAGLNSPTRQDMNGWYQQEVDAGFNALQGVPTPPSGSTALSQWLIADGQYGTVAALQDWLWSYTAYLDDGSIFEWMAKDYTNVSVYSVNLDSLPDLMSVNGSDPALYFFRRAGWPLRGVYNSVRNGEQNHLTLSYQDAVTMCTVTMGNGDLNSGADPNLDQQARGLAPLVMAGDVANCVGSMSRP